MRRRSHRLARSSRKVAQAGAGAMPPSASGTISTPSSPSHRSRVSLMSNTLRRVKAPRGGGSRDRAALPPSRTQVTAGRSSGALKGRMCCVSPSAASARAFPEKSSVWMASVPRACTCPPA